MRKLPMLRGRLSSRLLLSPHIHLDTLTAGEPEWNKSGTLLEGIQRWSERKETLTPEDVKTRTKTVLEGQIAKGIQHVRTPNSSLTARKAMLEVKEEEGDRGWWDRGVRPSVPVGTRGRRSCAKFF